MSITYSRQPLTKEILDRAHEIKRSTLRACYRWAKSTFQEVVDTHGAWVAYHNGEPVGYLVSWPQRKKRHCYIGGIAVHKRFQGRGIGARLISLAERHYKRRNFRQISLDVDVNNDAQLLYYRLGFRISRHSKKHSVVSMSKSLGRRRS